ncbi:MAG TPA: hypothetical protein ENN67_06725, partial [Firmicutes bacterium]|nr:hypothetical protein [Bacillota bacterium]
MTESVKIEHPKKNGKAFLYFVLSAVIFLVSSVVSFSVMAEDAYISFRYAENIGSGMGPVFNWGDVRVEGYSNPSWVAILAIFAKFGIDIIIVSRCLGLLFGILTLLELILIVRYCSSGNSSYGFLAAIILATSTPFLFWSQTGLETGLFAYLLILSIRLVILERDQPERVQWSILPIVLLSLTRPE